MVALEKGVVASGEGVVAFWPSQDITITNIAWCLACRRGGRRGVVCCAIVMQQHCTRVDNAGARGNDRRIDSCAKASK